MADKCVLLLAHGSPEDPNDVPEFLNYVTGGRPLPAEAIEEIQHRYALLGGSPLTRITLEQGRLLEQTLGVPVFVGMRNWKPFIADAVADIRARGIQHVIAICLAPQNSQTSVGLYHKVLRETAPDLSIDYVDSWHDSPLLAQAFAQKLTQGWERACAEAGATLPVIFTAHSVPERTIQEGDPYAVQAYETANNVAALGPDIDDWEFAFQSQGMSGGKWLGPTVEEVILKLKAEGHTGVFIQPIGFVCDHVEILYDIDVAFKQFAEQNGIKLWRAESLNTSLLFIRAVADLARSRLARAERAAAQQEHS